MAQWVYLAAQAVHRLIERQTIATQVVYLVAKASADPLTTTSEVVEVWILMGALTLLRPLAGNLLRIYIVRMIVGDLLRIYLRVARKIVN